MAESWITYVEAAKTLNMSLEGVRQRARREGWRKTLGNDGKARVMLPEAVTPGNQSAGDLSDTKAAAARLPAKQPGEVEALQARIVELRADLEREREETQKAREEVKHFADEAIRATRELAKAMQEAAARERELSDRQTSRRGWLGLFKAG